MYTQKIKVVLIVVCLLVVFLPNVIEAQWIRSEVTTGLGWVQEIQVGVGRNDGIKRLYIASPGSNAIYECTWNGTSWDRIQIGSSSFQMRDLWVWQYVHPRSPSSGSRPVGQSLAGHYACP